MSSDKFKLIGEAPIGALSETMHLEWARLNRARARIEALQEEYAQADAAFWDALERQFWHVTGLRGDAPTLRVTDDGSVYLDPCPCPICQAELHGLTVVEVVEQMYANSLISPEAIDHVRKKAKAVDLKNQTCKKLMN